MKRVFTLLLALTLIASCKNGCQTANLGAESQKETLNGAGATFPYPLYSKWAADYGQKTGAKLNYQSIGSGGGIQQIDARTVDFGASDEPQTPEKLDKMKLFQFPTVVGGVVLAIHVDGIEKEGTLKLNNDALCRIFLGDITTWSDERITKLNPDLNLPTQPITTVHRSDGSGTTAIFTHYLSEVCPDWKAKVGDGKSVKFPVGVAGKGNEGVSELVKRSANSIGYIEFAYAKQTGMNYTQLQNAAGDFVTPSIASFQAAAASGSFDAAKSFYAWLTNAPGKGAWPIAGATFILLVKDADKAEASKRVVKFYDWAFSNGDKDAEQLFYVPLPSELKERIRGYWKAHNLN